MQTSRRTFIKGAAAGLAGVASMGLLSSCQPTSPDDANADAKVGSSATTPAASSSGLPLNGYASGIDWLGAKPEISDDMISETRTYDVVVIGTGHAGTQVALAAAESGKVSVGVIEAQTEEEFTENGSEIGVFNSEVLHERDRVNYSDIGEVVNEYVRVSNGNAKASIIRKYVANSGAMFDHCWEVLQKSELGQKISAPGFMIVHTSVNENGEFDPDMYPIDEGNSKTWVGCAMFKVPNGNTELVPPRGASHHTGLWLISCLIDEAKAQGAEYHFGHKGIVLVQDDAGKVTGVIAQDAGGNYVKFEANKAVAVCTGDFSNNGVMVWSLIEELAEYQMRNGKTFEDAMGSWVGPSGRDGSGHKMACWAGGMIEESPRACQDAGGGATAPWGYSPLLQLNANGERFMNEADYYSLRTTCARQPKGLMAVVTDSQYLKTIVKAGVHHGGPDFAWEGSFKGLTEGMTTAGQNPGPEPNMVPSAVVGTTPVEVFSANTIEELAGYLGYEGQAAENFVNSVNHYNELCEAGSDSDFGKRADMMIPVNQPPFYGCVKENNGEPGLGLVTLCGLVTDDEFNVLDVDGNPIPGLFVVGNTLGGRFSLQYATPVAGSTLGMAMTHGRLLGKHLAEL